MKHALFLFPLLLFAGCDGVTNELNVESEPVSALAIRSITLTGKKADFTVLCSVPTPCHAYRKKQVAESGNNYSITFYAGSTDKNCIQRLDTLLVNESITFATSGIKNLHFYSSGATLDTTILIQ